MSFSGSYVFEVIDPQNMRIWPILHKNSFARMSVTLSTAFKRWQHTTSGRQLLFETLAPTAVYCSICRHWGSKSVRTCQTVLREYFSSCFGSAIFLQIPKTIQLDNETAILLATFLADRAPTHYDDRLLRRYCRLSVCLSVCDDCVLWRSGSV